MTAFPRHTRTRLAALMMSAVGLAACGSDGGDSATPQPTTTTTTSSTQPELPDDRDAIVVQFTTGGGITGPCCAFFDVPEITAYGDGRVVFVEGTVGQVVGLRAATVSRSDLADLMAEAAEAGLLVAGGPETGAICCDLAYTRVILGEDSATHEFSVMGLGFERESEDLSDEETRARRAVTDLRDRLRALALDSDGYGGYAPEELAVLVFPGSRDGGDEPTQWPLAGSLADGGIPTNDGGRCLHITNGDGAGDARAVLAAARQSTGSTWSSAGQDWTVFVRPLLPHEHACP